MVVHSCKIRLAYSGSSWDIHWWYISIKGAIAGGLIAGWVSQYLGRRLTIVCAYSVPWILFVLTLSLFCWVFLVSLFVSLEVRSYSQDIADSWFIFNDSLHSIMDTPYIVQFSLCRRFLHTVWCARSMGCRTCLFLLHILTLIYLFSVAIDPDSIGWNVTTCIQSYIPWRGLSSWECGYCVSLVLLDLISSDGVVRLGTNRSHRWWAVENDDHCEWRREECAWLRDSK